MRESILDRRVWRNSIAFTVAVFVSLMPSMAAACSVCMTGKEDDTRTAFVLMTAFMTLIPFVLVGGVVWWLRGRFRQVEVEHQRLREERERPEGEIRDGASLSL